MFYIFSQRKGRKCTQWQTYISIWPTTRAENRFNKQNWHKQKSLYSFVRFNSLLIIQLGHSNSAFLSASNDEVSHFLLLCIKVISIFKLNHVYTKMRNLLHLLFVKLISFHFNSLQKFTFVTFSIECFISYPKSNCESWKMCTFEIRLTEGSWNSKKCGKCKFFVGFYSKGQSEIMLTTNNEKWTMCESLWT